jgi:nicotinamidase-related amidase
MSEVLLLIDIQNDYFPGGNAPLHEPMKAAQCASRLLDRFRELRKPVIHIQHISTRADATFFLPNTEGARIHPSVAPLDTEATVEKHFPNAFRETQLLACLREKKIASLAIAGMMTHMCVDTTVRAAADHGFECKLAADACATKALQFQGKSVTAPDVQAAFLASLAGAFARVDTTDNILAKLT